MQLKDKTILFLGSSVTYGYASGGVSFADVMAEQYGCISVKEAVSGTTLADLDDTSYVARMKRMDKSIKADLFVCQLSTNDATKNIDMDLIEAAIREILEYAAATWRCPILFYTGTRYDSPQYFEMIKLLERMSEEYDFDILDLWTDPKMCSVSDEDYARYMKDPIHPTLEGYRDWWTPKFVEFIEKYI